jgi:hypothetical protein
MQAACPVHQERATPEPMEGDALPVDNLWKSRDHHSKYRVVSMAWAKSFAMGPDLVVRIREQNRQVFIPMGLFV